MHSLNAPIQEAMHSSYSQPGACVQQCIIYSDMDAVWDEVLEKERGVSSQCPTHAMSPLLMHPPVSTSIDTLVQVHRTNAVSVAPPPLQFWPWGAGRGGGRGTEVSFRSSRFLSKFQYSTVP